MAGRDEVDGRHEAVEPGPDPAQPPVEPSPVSSETTASSPASTEPIRSPTGREVAPGGWRRAVTGVAVGVAAGLLHRLARHVDEDDPRPDGARVDPARDGSGP